MRVVADVETERTYKSGKTIERNAHNLLMSISGSPYQKKLLESKLGVSNVRWRQCEVKTVLEREKGGDVRWAT